MKHTFIYDCDCCDKPTKTPLKVTIDVSVQGIEGFYGTLLQHYEICPECYRLLKQFIAKGGKVECAATT